MERFWTLGKSNFGSYDFRKLINTRVLENFIDDEIHIVCDIDKTYLETSFANSLQMLKIAFEDAKDKITVPGAAPFLLACRWASPYTLPCSDTPFNPRPLHFVSASPPQLRSTLEAKLKIDGIDWSSDSFKNQAYNIRKGKLGLLRHHVSYKTATLYSLMKQAKAGSRFILVGDNAEFDTFIYMGMAYYLHGRLDPDQYTQYLLAGGVQDEIAPDLRRLLQDRPDVKIEAILIREAPGYTTVHHHPITQGVTFFSDYFQAMCYMMFRKVIEIESLPTLVRRFHNQNLFSRELLLSHLISFREHVTLTESESKVVTDTIDTLATIAPTGLIPEHKNQYQKFSPYQDNLEGDALVQESKVWAQKLTREGQ